MRTVDRGALPARYAATSPQAQGVRFHGPDGLGRFAGVPAEPAVHEAARNEADAARPWDVSGRPATHVVHGIAYFLLFLHENGKVRMV
ncbi:hypothetical protein [Streptosporangium lutulentum]|uniref:Uncharacterized protein n=1 Tax=Streptosporangium lutulentum TaxID=1461250 RepID=A0ABT9Q7C7_9ACTN|nr:hypothetical protein [Streptosporangium lutulentum]MDP9842648.1 hypothetical protein [Streptosporangium lutulentum]